MREGFANRNDLGVFPFLDIVGPQGYTYIAVKKKRWIKYTIGAMKQPLKCSLGLSLRQHLAESNSKKFMEKVVL